MFLTFEFVCLIKKRLFQASLDDFLAEGEQQTRLLRCGRMMFHLTLIHQKL